MVMRCTLMSWLTSSRSRRKHCSIVSSHEDCPCIFVFCWCGASLEVIKNLERVRARTRCFADFLLWPRRSDGVYTCVCVHLYMCIFWPIHMAVYGKLLIAGWVHILCWQETCIYVHMCHARHSNPVMYTSHWISAEHSVHTRPARAVSWHELSDTPKIVVSVQCLYRRFKFLSMHKDAAHEHWFFLGLCFPENTIFRSPNP